MPFAKGNQEAKKKGKHRTTLEKEMALDFIREKIKEELEPIIDNLILQGKGEDNPIPAIKELLDRLVGKPEKEVDMNVGLKLGKLEEIQTGFNKIIKKISNE